MTTPAAIRNGDFVVPGPRDRREKADAAGIAAVPNPPAAVPNPPAAVTTGDRPKMPWE